MKLDNLYPSKIDVDSISEKLKKFGVCYIDNFFNNSEMVKLNDEFNNILDMNNSVVPDHINNSILHAKNLDPLKFNFKDFNLLFSIKNNQLFKKISKKYLGSVSFFPKKIFLVKSFGKNEKDYLKDKKLAYVPHTDEVQYLKFFIYLTDVDNEHGPLTVAPSTHSKFKKIRHEWIKKNFDPLRRDKINYDHEHEMITLPGKRGTLIIFDTDCLHKAGSIMPGYQRKIIRLDVYSGKENFTTFNSRFYLKVKKLINILKKKIKN